jgi:hypothetical protein
VDRKGTREGSRAAGQLPEVGQHLSEVVQAHGHVRVVGAKPSLEDGQGPLKKGAGMDEVAKLAQHSPRLVRL